jgi:DNA-binding NtrC family response regulator
VLIVDDDDLVRWALGESLKDSGCTVREARNGCEAMSAVMSADEPFDVVVLDYALPDSCDLRLLNALRHVSPESRVIMVTGYDTQAVAQGALALGASDVVPKPFDVSAITALVRA